jgi:hypothetical protein
MSEEQNIGEHAENQGEQAAAGRRTVTEEVKVAADNLVEILNTLVREGTVRRVTILRNDRVLVDIPLAVGAGAALVLATQMPVISALAGVGMLFTGCTLRIEREEPPAGS